jgi:hypothetical protein
MAGPSASEVLVMFIKTAAGAPWTPLKAHLLDAGWREIRSSGRGEWRHGDIVATQFGQGEHAFLEATLEIA